MHVLLELDCVPSGMELFPAADEDQWSLIKGVIDDCDYYIVIIAGRYGSVGLDGVSYTEKEYCYAVEKNKPVAAFLHSDPGSIAGRRLEQKDEGKEKLQAFRTLVQQKMCKNWSTPHELGSVVARSLTQLRKKHPSVGWVRGDQVPEREAIAEILGLRKQIERLESKLNEARITAPPNTERLAQGKDILELTFSMSSALEFFDSMSTPEWQGTCVTTLSWNEIFYTVSPLMIHETEEAQMRSALEQRCHPACRDQFNEITSRVICSIDAECFRTIIVQLRALGLMEKSTRPRSVKDTTTYWTLTPYGDNVMNRLRAITRGDTDIVDLKASDLN